ncbi:MAG: hypothetical protein ACK5WC_06860 [Aphanizomenon sp.]|jgi:hypothetical protein
MSDLRMPFDHLLLSGCLVPDKTSHTEDGVEVSLKRESGETVLFFHIDDQSNPNCKLRQILGLDQEGMPMCDLIVFYARETERIICFVELKGGDLDKAKKQVINTYEKFNKLVQKSQSTFTPKTYIVFNGGSSHNDIKGFQEELKNKFGEGNYDISRNSDLGNFLRGAKYQPKGKQKKGR